MKTLACALLAMLVAGQAAAESYSTRDQFGKVRNHATHEAAETIITGGTIVSSAVERGTHMLAVINDAHVFNCVIPWDSPIHCRSETSEPLFDLKE